MNIRGKFQRLLKLYNYHMIYCGCEVMDANFRVSWRTFISMFCVSLYYVCFVNLILNHSDHILESLATFGVSTQVYVKVYLLIEPSKSTFLNHLVRCAKGACKFYMAIKDRKDISNLVEGYRKLYDEMMPEGPKSKRYQVLNKHVDLCTLLYKAYAIIISGALSLCPLYPIFMYVAKNRFDYILAVYVPFLDPWSGSGYIVNSFYHILCVILLGNGSLAADNGFILFVIHFSASTKLFAVQIDELNELLVLPLDGRKNCQSDRKRKIKTMVEEIIKTHKTIIEKIKCLDEMLFMPIAVQILTAVFSLAISLFLAATTNYFPAYALFMVSLFQLFLYCGMGTIIEKKSDDLSKDIYNINWHLLPLEEEKKIVVLLQRSQKSLVFFIAGLAELNVSTCVEILKKIYSFFMLLMNSV